MCVMSFQVQLNLRHPIGTEAPPISQRLGVPRCWSCHRLTKFAVHLGPLHLCSKKQSSSQLTAVKDSTSTFLSSKVLDSLFKYECLSHSHILNFSSVAVSSARIHCEQSLVVSKFAFTMACMRNTHHHFTIPSFEVEGYCNPKL